MTGDRKPAVCVLGTGLIGGSVLRAAVAAGYEAWGFNRSEPGVRAARADGFDVSADIGAVLGRAADRDALIVIGVPQPALDTVLSDVRSFAPACPLTDVISVKKPVLDAVHRHELGAHFVGGHPMAGTSESGWAASTPDLFKGAAWAISVDPGVHADPWTRVARLALGCGAVVVPVLSAEHDSAVARISHLPHVLAEALAIQGAGGGALALGLAAGSFRDGTRVAATAPALVRAICEPNADALLEVLDDTLRVLAAARDSLRDTDSLAQLTEAGHDARNDYDTFRRWAIEGIRPGDHDWLAKLAEAGRRGGVIEALE
ncbi:prephenate dehydrogenase [Nocardia otitidiscaviarum]|uniref:Prephenate dehydrogenase n=1 Tax=Nocardia otitidiscaviarum TaxID=1823 RepID=A0A516NU20_9NOCA|nr:prephenate dehydrogenase [Nocardia otitidiscaviarum]MCP9621775.1 prephenate dehydrogenase [Nocardia otitidiscaviarum]QDP82410.1 prephenate dehydrogenase [Nocardia otitidiscaviarum]